MSTFLSLSDDDIELLNRQFGLKLTREEWNRRLTTTPTFASLVRSYFDWHISELAALAAGLHIGYMAVLAANNSVFIGHSSRLFVR